MFEDIVIVLLLVIFAIFLFVITKASLEQEVAKKKKEQEAEAMLSDLYTEHLLLNNKALEAHKAMIHASFMASADMQKKSQKLP